MEYGSLAGQIVITKKTEQEPLAAGYLKDLLPYRVVKVKEGYKDASVDDIILKFPSDSHRFFILNCTRQKMLASENRSEDWQQEFFCKRAHDIQSITFVIDYDHP
jgi:hypothetical protein